MTKASNTSAAGQSGKRPLEEPSSSVNAKKARLGSDVGDAAGGELGDGTEPSSSESNDVKKYSGKLYHEDGNTILVAEKIAFKVHRTFLAGRSELFKDMFELANPEDGEHFDGCPAIHLSDKVDDLIVFLEALYGYITIPAIEPDFKKFSAVLRLSIKYMADMLRSLCLWQLSLAKVPRTLHVYDRNILQNNRLKFNYHYLVYKIDAKSLLPTSFYALCTVYYTWIKKLGPGRRSPPDMLRLYKGKAILFSKFVGILNGLEMTTEDCRSCQPKKEALFQSVSSWLIQPNILDKLDPLYTLYVIREKCCGALCGSCQHKIKNQISEARQKIWDALPEIFEFGSSWDALKDDWMLEPPQNDSA